MDTSTARTLAEQCWLWHCDHHLNITCSTTTTACAPLHTATAPAQPVKHPWSSRPLVFTATAFNRFLAPSASSIGAQVRKQPDPCLTFRQLLMASTSLGYRGCSMMLRCNRCCCISSVRGGCGDCGSACRRCWVTCWCWWGYCCRCCCC